MFGKIRSQMKINDQVIGLLVLLMVTVGLRLYKTNRPLNQDEIYTSRLATLGFSSIIQNTWTDTHPPLFYLLEWGISGLGQFKSELEWRWFSVISGSLAVLLIWRLSRYYSGRSISYICSLVAATSPFLVFMSQLARSYSLIFLVSTLSLWVFLAIIEKPNEIRFWLIYIAISIVGVYTNYFYFALVVTQLILLGILLYQNIHWWVSGILVLIISSPLIPYAFSSLSKELARHASSETLTLWRTIQVVFASEPLYFGYSIAHIVQPILAILFTCISFYLAIKSRERKLVFMLLQPVVLLGAFFLIGPIFGIQFPLQEAKQFILILPPLLISFAVGWDGLARWLKRKNQKDYLTLLLTVSILALNFIGLRSYWDSIINPEAVAIADLNRKIHPGDRVVSLDLAVDYSLDHYTNNVPVYRSPQKSGDTYRYQLISSGDIFRIDFASRNYKTTISKNNKTTADIQARGRFWILSNVNRNRDPIIALLAGCKVLEQKNYSARHAAIETILVDCKK